MQTCTKCRLEKDDAEFDIDKSRKTGLRAVCKKCRSLWEAQRRLRVMQYYSKSDEPYCACCEEKTYLFLALDHIGGGGRQERKKLGGGNYWYFLDSNRPEGYQVLCHNCNLGRHINGGVCPHEFTARNNND